MGDGLDGVGCSTFDWKFQMLTLSTPQNINLSIFTDGINQIYSHTLQDILMNCMN